MSALTQEDRAVLARIADYLIPDAEGMPAASRVGVAELMTDKVLAVRHDLAEPLVEALRMVADQPDGEAAAKALVEKSVDAFNTVSLVATAAYTMSPQTREALGYPGQEARPFDADHTLEDWMAGDLLKPVIDRGPIYRPTPK